MNNPSFYAIIPANVRYDKELTPNAKLLYGEITALCNEKGYCWAGNGYFAKLYNVEVETISRWISSLNKKRHIRVEIDVKDGNSRKIYILPESIPIDKIINTSCENNQYPIDKIIKHNNTSNNTSNNTKEETTTTTAHTGGVNPQEFLPQASVEIPEANERLRFFPFLERSGLSLERLNELADLFSYITEQQNRRTLIKETEWIDLCKKLFAEGMQVDGIKSLYRYCKEVCKKEVITPKVMDWKFAEYKNFQTKKAQPKQFLVY